LDSAGRLSPQAAFWDEQVSGQPPARAGMILPTTYAVSFPPLSDKKKIAVKCHFRLYPNEFRKNHEVRPLMANAPSG
jgi:hypothetical protein